MDMSKKTFLIGPNEDTLAELLIADEDEGWFTGKVVCQRFPSEVKKALDWYDEVVRDQLLSHLDEATDAVQRFELRVKNPDGSIHKIYSLHVGLNNELSFRIDPVLPPPELPNEMIL